MRRVAATAPRHLSRASRRLWRQLAEDYALGDEPHALRTLTLACEALDRGEEARERIALDGAYLTDRFGQLKAHPAVAVERDARIAAMRAFRELSLDPDPGEVRPPRVGSGARS